MLKEGRASYLGTSPAAPWEGYDNNTVDPLFISEERWKRADFSIFHSRDMGQGEREIIKADRIGSSAAEAIYANMVYVYGEAQFVYIWEGGVWSVHETHSKLNDNYDPKQELSGENPRKFLIVDPIGKVLSDCFAKVA